MRQIENGDRIVALTLVDFSTRFVLVYPRYFLKL